MKSSRADRKAQATHGRWRDQFSLESDLRGVVSTRTMTCLVLPSSRAKSFRSRLVRTPRLQGLRPLFYFGAPHPEWSGTQCALTDMELPGVVCAALRKSRTPSNLPERPKRSRTPAGRTPRTRMNVTGTARCLQRSSIPHWCPPDERSLRFRRNSFSHRIRST
jgi:hypothetical protein